MNAICVFTNNMNKKINGNVFFKETQEGLQIKISISGRNPGKHGLHIHEYGDLTEVVLHYVVILILQIQYMVEEIVKNDI